MAVRPGLIHVIYVITSGKAFDLFVCYFIFHSRSAANWKPRAAPAELTRDSCVKGDKRKDLSGHVGKNIHSASYRQINSDSLWRQVMHLKLKFPSNPL